MQVNIDEIFQDKTIRSKAKTAMLGSLLLNQKLNIDELVTFTKQEKDSVKATCIEAMEYATKIKPSIASEKCFTFLIASLTCDAPAVKREAARTIGNIASAYSSKLKFAVKELLANTEHSSTVVRWAAAYALGEIIKLNTTLNKDLVPAIVLICEQEENNGVKKKYMEALKKN